MSDGIAHPEWRALLAAVRANPVDDLPRLVAADWLEEHGEGGSPAPNPESLVKPIRRTETSGSGNVVFTRPTKLRHYQPSGERSCSGSSSQ